MDKRKIKKKFKKTVDQLHIKDKKNLHAIAIKYDVGKDKAPKITAAGKGDLAEKILYLAEENRIPMYEDESLSALLNKLKIEREIPPQMYALIAEVLAVAYQLEQMAKKRKIVSKKLKKK